MKLFRNKFFIRLFSWVTTFTFLINLFEPMNLLALTSGPHQPEFTSYEDAGSTDMVNLLTGDFNLSFPILSVPIGSEGLFTVPLSYHAGIGPETEASWAGLGWNINIGSLTRSINGFPDDANAETQTVQVKDLTGNRGWYSRGIGWNIGWDSQVGHYGVIHLGPINTSWANGETVYGIGAITVGDNNKITAGEVLLTAVQVVSAILSWGVSQIIIDVATDIYETSKLSDAFSGIYRAPKLSGAGGYWPYTKETDKRLFHTNYWIWLDKTRIEKMYGTLYLDKPQVENYLPPSGFASVGQNINNSNVPQKKFITSPGTTIEGAASDINIDLNNAANYWNNLSPTGIACDNYNVNGPGIVGNIKPYRFEIGSVSVPREMTAMHARFASLPFMDYGLNKVPFVYAGSMQNNYYHHVGAQTTITDPTFHFGLNMTVSGSLITNHLNDLIFSAEQRMRPDVLTNNKKLVQGHFVHWLTNAEIKNTSGKFNGTPFVDYFSGTARTQFRTSFEFGGRKTFTHTAPSSSYANGGAYNKIPLGDGQAGNFSNGDKVDVHISMYLDTDMEYQTLINYSNYQDLTVQSVNTTTGNNYIILNQSVSYWGNMNYVTTVTKKSSPKPDHSIGGFVITSADGMNYHFSLPVYDYDFKTETIDKNDPNKRSTITRSSAFANT